MGTVGVGRNGFFKRGLARDWLLFRVPRLPIRPPGKVLLVSLEDPFDSIVTPRLEAADADMANVAVLSETEDVTADGVVDSTRNCRATSN